MPQGLCTLRGSTIHERKKREKRLIKDKKKGFENEQKIEEKKQINIFLNIAFQPHRKQRGKTILLLGANCFKSIRSFMAFFHDKNKNK